MNIVRFHVQPLSMIPRAESGKQRVDFICESDFTGYLYLSATRGGVTLADNMEFPVQSGVYVCSHLFPAARQAEQSCWRLTDAEGRLVAEYECLWGGAENGLFMPWCPRILISDCIIRRTSSATTARAFWRWRWSWQKRLRTTQGKTAIAMRLKGRGSGAITAPTADAALRREWCGTTSTRERLPLAAARREIIRRFTAWRKCAVRPTPGSVWKKTGKSVVPP